ncbi:hypothetical protein [Lachnoanaerobaculum umeaense]|jgi:hypothetical protein|uniref:Uncharacterized protein n=1 Tax=Lachnoanaerobaculum umeaense TaxID=617123 RepID=A0A385Q3I2_9FIRM|nr:hypothetical protein [Lachnoanaerobaculum umeaense]AYB00235.1 hypothetical protein D4A81_09970 [Lachnoanaerobaculum umeaense]PZW96727.1 hypothetical protein C7439_11154 [Lachnoanaerobaculum umeaense]
MSITRKEVDEIVTAATEVANSARNIRDINEVIEEIKNWSLEEGALFNMNLYTQKIKYGVVKKIVDLETFLSSDEQLPIREALIQALKEKREEYTSNFQEDTKEFEKLAKEVQR